VEDTFNMRGRPAQALVVIAVLRGGADRGDRINPEPPRGCVGQGGLTEVVLAVAVGPAASPLPVVARWPACWP